MPYAWDIWQLDQRAWETLTPAERYTLCQHAETHRCQDEPCPVSAPLLALARERVARAEAFEAGVAEGRKRCADRARDLALALRKRTVGNPDPDEAHRLRVRAGALDEFAVVAMGECVDEPKEG